MPAERFFADSLFENNASIKLEDQEFHHLVNVMRAGLGDSIELVNGQGQLAVASLQTIEKKRAFLEITSIQFSQEPTFQKILAQAIPRGNRLDFILEKGTELGMTDIWLFPGKLSERSEISSNQLERMRALTIAAMKQCGRLYLPKISVMPTLAQWKALPYPSYYGDVNPKAPSFASQWLSNKPQQGAIFFIGPESGFHDKEIEVLKQLDVQGVNLHPNILRTDTAALTALVLMGLNSCPCP